MTVRLQDKTGVLCTHIFYYLVNIEQLLQTVS